MEALRSVRMEGRGGTNQPHYSKNDLIFSQLFKTLKLIKMINHNFSNFSHHFLDGLTSIFDFNFLLYSDNNSLLF